MVGRDDDRRGQGLHRWQRQRQWFLVALGSGTSEVLLALGILLLHLLLRLLNVLPLHSLFLLFLLILLLFHFSQLTRQDIVALLRLLAAFLVPHL